MTTVDYSYLDSFEAEYKPQQAFRVGLESLPDGDYDLTVTDAALDQVQGKNIARIGLRTHKGQSVEKTYWFNNQVGLNSFAADLLILNFDADKWCQAGRPLSVEIPKAVAGLRGVVFRARKVSRAGKDKAGNPTTYHDLHISGRVNPGSPPPAANGQPQPPLPPPADDPIPF